MNVSERERESDDYSYNLLTDKPAYKHTAECLINIAYSWFTVFSPSIDPRCLSIKTHHALFRS